MTMPEKNRVAVTIVKALSRLRARRTSEMPARPDAMNWMSMQNTIRASMEGLWFSSGKCKEKWHARAAFTAAMAATVKFSATASKPSIRPKENVE